MAEQEEQPREACLLIIGNEILSGRTQDANLAYIGRRLAELGVPLLEVRVVPDREAMIISALNELRARYAYVFTTGGIGPTHDDITAACVAKAFGVALIENPKARAILEAHYQPGQLNEARLRMARTPEGAELIENPISRAPGFRIGNVFVMAGIPSVMQAMFENVAPNLKGGPPVISRTVVCPLPEGTIAKALGALQSQHPEIEIGSYPAYRDGRFLTSLVLRGTDSASIERAAEELMTLIRALGAEPSLETPA